MCTKSNQLLNDFALKEHLNRYGFFLLYITPKLCALASLRKLDFKLYLFCEINKSKPSFPIKDQQKHTKLNLEQPQQVNNPYHLQSPVHPYSVNVFILVHISYLRNFFFSIVPSTLITHCAFLDPPDQQIVIGAMVSEDLQKRRMTRV